MGNHVVNTFILIFTKNLTTHEVSTEFLNNNFFWGEGDIKMHLYGRRDSKMVQKNLYIGKYLTFGIASERKGNEISI